MFAGKIEPTETAETDEWETLPYIEEAEELEESMEKGKNGISICRIGNSPRQSKINNVKNIMPTRPPEERNHTAGDAASW